MFAGEWKESDSTDDIPTGNVIGYEHWGGPRVRISYQQGDHRWERPASSAREVGPQGGLSALRRAESAWTPQLVGHASLARGRRI
jgi:hypothetical protein